MDGATGLGTRPGWVVSYAPSTRQYGSAFFVSFFGKMLARGTPALVHEQHERDQHTLEVFTDSFARLDAAIQEGIPFSNVVAILGDQYVALTNENGSFSAYYDYTPRSMAPVEWITNGFSLVISNGVVIHKAHSYMSSQ